MCKSIGADATINYTTENLREALKALTDGKGPDVIYDPVGGDFAEPAFRSPCVRIVVAPIEAKTWGRR